MPNEKASPDEPSHTEHIAQYWEHCRGDPIHICLFLLLSGSLFYFSFHSLLMRAALIASVQKRKTFRLFFMPP